jgi:hypothetical protein
MAIGNWLYSYDTEKKNKIYRSDISLSAKLCLYMLVHFLYRFYGLSLTEIGALLNISPSSVKIAVINFDGLSVTSDALKSDMIKIYEILIKNE